MFVLFVFGIFCIVAVHFVLFVMKYAGKKQGYLTKRKKDADEWKDRWFVLSKDFFSYYLVYQVQPHDYNVTAIVANVLYI